MLYLHLKWTRRLFLPTSLSYHSFVTNNSPHEIPSTAIIPQLCMKTVVPSLAGADQSFGLFRPTNILSMVQEEMSKPAMKTAHVQHPTGVTGETLGLLPRGLTSAVSGHSKATLMESRMVEQFVWSSRTNSSRQFQRLSRISFSRSAHWSSLPAK